MVNHYFYQEHGILLDGQTPFLLGTTKYIVVRLDRIDKHRIRQYLTSIRPSRVLLITSKENSAKLQPYLFSIQLEHDLTFQVVQITREHEPNTT